MKALAITWINVRRMLRERSNIFFVFVFPLGIILLIGAQFGGGVVPAVGVYQADDSQLASGLATAIEAEERFDTIIYEDSEELIAAVERGSVQSGVFLPAGMDQVVAAGDVVEVEFFARPGGFGAQLQQVTGSAISRVMTPVAAAQFVAAEVGADFDVGLEVALDLKDETPGVSVETSAVGEALFPDTLGRFDLGASQQLVLFVFLTALAGSSALILTRQLGISKRMLSTPTSIRTIVVGEGGGRLGTAMVQGLYIMAATLLLFRVNWGDPVGALLLLAAFSAVGAAAGLLMGAVFSNDQQAAGIGIVLSLGLAALGGSMLPSELFSPTLQRISHLTPHAWALDGFAELVRRNGTVGDILLEVGVLSAYAAILFLLAAWRLRVAITRP